MGNGKSAIRTLPLPSGLYSVGFVDIMRGYSLDGVFLRLYFPIEKCDLLKSPAQLRPWIPREEYLDGYAIFAKVPASVLRFFFNWVIGDVFIPALYGAPLFSGDAIAKFPIVIFSHGLLANRTTYSTICTDLASHGLIVVAVEHRDGSASFSYYLKESSTPSATLEEPVPYRQMAAGEKEFHVRHAQVNTRVDECQRTLELLETINSGQDISNLLPDAVDFHAFKGRLDLDRVAIMGHSFGGATVIAALAHDQRYKVGVVLDGWMYPLHNNIYPRVQSPLLFVNMEKFQWRDNVIRMKRLDSTIVDRLMFTIRGSVHQNQTDFTFLVKGWLAEKLCARGETDPFLCNDINNELCLAFLRKHLGLQGNSNIADVVAHYKDWIIVGTNVNVDEPLSSL